ncbi:MAG: sigma-70 family RNA polymerase sigma factor [Sedimentisphaerales bacterium]
MADDTGQNKQQGLIHRLRDGDEGAFAEFVQRYQQQVFMCCRLLGLGADESQDVASETFMAVYRGIAGFTGRAKISTWLWKITYNKAISFIRQKIRNQKLQEKLQGQYAEEQEIIDSGQSPDENSEIVWNAVKKLPQDQALAVVLHYRQEKSIKEIADIMEKRQNTVKVLLFRGRERLKELLSNKIEGLC